MITYKRIAITGNSGEYYFRFNHVIEGPFDSYQEAQEAIEDMLDQPEHDPENIYGLASIRQSIKERTGDDPRTARPARHRKTRPYGRRRQVYPRRGLLRR